MLLQIQNSKHREDRECYSWRNIHTLSGYIRKDFLIYYTIKFSCPALPLITPPWPQYKLL